MLRFEYIVDFMRHAMHMSSGCKERVVIDVETVPVDG
jgi:hypothetical protein